MIPESSDPSRDYPQMAAERGRIEPAPRRVRGYFDNILVFDTTHARYVWEVPYYPQYYIPLSDVRMGHLLDEDHAQHVLLGPSRLYSLSGDRRTSKGAARVYDVEGDGPVAGYVRFEWETLDWFEEDERMHGHPRNPYVRVDALRSHRQVRVEIGGVVLGETGSPVLLFETGCQRGITSTAQTSSLCISRSAIRSRFAPIRGKRRGIGRRESGIRFIRTSLGPTTTRRTSWRQLPASSPSITK